MPPQPARGSCAESEGPPIGKGVRIIGDSRERLRASLQEQYSAGASIRSLAHDLGRSYGFVHKILAESGVALRSRGGPNRKKSHRAD
ncbi:transcriptional regulator [Rhodococcus sp. PAMC28707]|uniref:helix-turn-helix domain-containing protein n=1 Tax=unclassified Rhodococcus (in: high G+C Gram-positive bacteria) TaxID=192944 RepID=UPI00109DD609|nr:MULTISPECIES: helix-turn-helix domain-containing protein [unclassified Rhodococcus (in: high G+C Gram-positive bacteria)]QCB51100.1 transcriptional regulator [Rhodococcus sp. PAMC28705]QCB57209.1 transcriptional regulator [Rhodococcus sp. PAMC28707]